MLIFLRCIFLPVPVRPVIQREIEKVLASGLPVQAGVHVIKPVINLIVEQGQDGFGKDRMHEAPANGVGKPLAKGAVGMDFIGKKADGIAPAQGIAVSGGRLYVNHGGQAPAEPCRIIALVDGCVAYGLGREGGEKPESVLSLPYRDAVQEDEILVGITTPYAKAGKALVGGLDTGKKLQHLERVFLAENHRKFIQGSSAYPKGTGARM